MLQASIIRAANTPVPGEPGYDNLAYLRELAGWILASVAVLIVIAGAVSIIMWLVGKVSAHSKAQATAMVIAFNVFIGAAILGSVGGLVYYGSGLGKFNLMPAGAQQPTVDVTKNPAKSTCPKAIDMVSILNHRDPEKMKAALQKMVSPTDVSDITAGDRTEISLIEWFPKGPDCTSGNQVPDPCKQVKVSTSEGVTQENKRDWTPDPINKVDCQS